MREEMLARSRERENAVRQQLLRQRPRRQRKQWLIVLAVSVFAGAYTMLVMAFPVALLILPLFGAVVWYAMSKL